MRAQPAGAPQPWLPVRDLRMRYTAVPQQLRTGEAGTLTVETTVVGATQAQLPELPAPSIPGAQVFAEPPQFDERFAGGTPQVTLTRRYSVVPSQAGTLVVPGTAMAWWDVRAGAARRATLPDLTLPVVVGTGAPSSTPFAGASGAAAAPSGGAGDDILLGGERRVPPHLWPWLAAGFVGMTAWLDDAGMVLFVPVAAVVLTVVAAVRWMARQRLAWRVDRAIDLEAWRTAKEPVPLH